MRHIRFNSKLYFKIMQGNDTDIYHILTNMLILLIINKLLLV